MSVRQPMEATDLAFAVPVMRVKWTPSELSMRIAVSFQNGPVQPTQKLSIVNRS